MGQAGTAGLASWGTARAGASDPRRSPPRRGDKSGAGQRLGVSRPYLPDLERGRRAVSKKMPQTIVRKLVVSWKVYL
jgi:hypothetical protein